MMEEGAGYGKLCVKLLFYSRFIKKAFSGQGEISYICFHYELDGKSYLDDLGETMSFAAFYEAMAKGADTKTSQINVAEFEEYFEGFLKEGKDVLHLTLSSGISGAYNSARLAKISLEEKYPERKIHVVDSLCASSGYGLLMDRLADLRDAGQDIDQVCRWAEENKGHLQSWFFSTDLTFFIKGGRVTKTAGFVGTMLRICPLLHVDKEGKLIPKQKVRTKKMVIEAIVKKMEELAEDGTAYSGKCYLSHSACLADAEAVAALVEKRFPRLDGKVQINDIGTTIGSHTGPGTVALFFWGAER